MTTHALLTRAYEEKVDAQLDQAQAHIAEFESSAKAKEAPSRDQHHQP